MMEPRQVEQGALFYNFSLDAHVPGDHLLRSIDRFVELSELRRDLAAFYSSIGRPSVDPELMRGGCDAVQALEQPVLHVQPLLDDRGPGAKLWWVCHLSK